ALSQYHTFATGLDGRDSDYSGAQEVRPLSHFFYFIYPYERRYSRILLLKNADVQVRDKSRTPDTALIVNPNSCSGLRGKNWNELYEKMEKIFGNGIKVAFSKRSGNGTTLARDMLRKGFDKIVAIGGDGTINEVANGKFLGGGFMAAPEADMADGLLELMVLKDSGSLKMLDELANLKTGHYAGEDKILYSKAKKVLITSMVRRVTVTIDGEPVGILPATFQALPEALTVVA